MTVLKGAVPWWGLPLNWAIGGSRLKRCLFMHVLKDNNYSHLRQPRRKSLLRCNPRKM